jgi:hypothetical protein
MEEGELFDELMLVVETELDLIMKEFVELVVIDNEVAVLSVPL